MKRQTESGLAQAVKAAAGSAEAGARLMAWLSDGYAAGMAYLHKTPEVRFDPRRRFPEAESLVMLALNYYLPDPAPDDGNGAPPSEPAGRIARYAWGEDYHRIVEEKLAALIGAITALGGRCWKGYVDHGPLLERAFAERAGLGFIGKNTLLITPGFGSWVFLAAVVTDLRLESDPPAVNGCGGCRRCLDACPTGALTAAYRLDARRCISYLTIEHKGPLPEGDAAMLDGWLFGCDLCQTVCPYNSRPVPTDVPAFSPGRGAGPILSLREVEEIGGNADFKRRFAKSPLLRARRKGLVRNAAALRRGTETPR